MWTNSGEHEPVKGVVHGMMLGLALTCTTYNTIAWIRRKDTHLCWNMIIYGSLSLFEALQVKRHYDAATESRGTGAAHHLAEGRG